ncbi:MAG: type 1 glutamine amidotransferase [Promethearchaeota archaeon]
MNIVIVDNIRNSRLIETGRWQGIKAAIDDYNSTVVFTGEKATVKIIKYLDLADPPRYAELQSADGVILTGSRFSLTRLENKPKVKAWFDPEITFIQETTKPVLGICFGHQLIGYAFGFKIVDCPRKEGGIHDLNVEREYPLVEKGTGVICVEQHHEKQIDPGADLDGVFVNHASNGICKYQMIKHVEKPIFGVQFHPETLRDADATTHGRMIFKKFLDLVRAHQK